MDVFPVHISSPHQSRSSCYASSSGENLSSEILSKSDAVYFFHITMLISTTGSRSVQECSEVVHEQSCIILSAAKVAQKCDNYVKLFHQKECISVKCPGKRGNFRISCSKCVSHPGEQCVFRTSCGFQCFRPGKRGVLRTSRSKCGSCPGQGMILRTGTLFSEWHRGLHISQSFMAQLVQVLSIG